MKLVSALGALLVTSLAFGCTSGTMQRRDLEGVAVLPAHPWCEPPPREAMRLRSLREPCLLKRLLRDRGFDDLIVWARTATAGCRALHVYTGRNCAAFLVSILTNPPELFPSSAAFDGDMYVGPEVDNAGAICLRNPRCGFCSRVSTQSSTTILFERLSSCGACGDIDWSAWYRTEQECRDDAR